MKSEKKLIAFIYEYNVFPKRNANNAGKIARARAIKTSVFVNIFIINII